MGYEEFLLSVSQHDKFEIVKKKYDEAFFGNFQIDVCFSGKLDIEIVRDRGIVEIQINHYGIFKKHQIPIWFAINILEGGEVKPPVLLDSLSKAQRFLFDHVPSLQLMIEEELLNEISRRWSRWRWISRINR